MSELNSELRAEPAFAIETHALARRFGAVEAVKGVDLRVPTGSIFGLVGPNGAGKTTTFSMLCGFLQPSAGRAVVLGHAPTDRGALAGRLTALAQDAPLPARPRILDSVAYWARLGGLPAPQARRDAQAALERVGLGSDLNRRGGELSHGMTKRVGLAQAFLGAPELVLLDEPTAGLDPKNAHEVKQLIREQRGRATVVLSSHDLTQLEELCDAVAIIDHGRLVTQGTMAELTGRGLRVRLELADVNAAAAAAEACRRLPFVKQADFVAATRVLDVHWSDTRPDDAIPAILQAALAAGAKVIGVSRGQRLEERVLEIT